MISINYANKYSNVDYSPAYRKIRLECLNEKAKGSVVMLGLPIEFAIMEVTLREDLRNCSYQQGIGLIAQYYRENGYLMLQELKSAHTHKIDPCFWHHTFTGNKSMFGDTIKWFSATCNFIDSYIIDLLRMITVQIDEDNLIPDRDEANFVKIHFLLRKLPSSLPYKSIIMEFDFLATSAYNANYRDFDFNLMYDRTRYLHSTPEVRDRMIALEYDFHRSGDDRDLLEKTTEG